mmetsp:Transcript_100476/g.299782  ORF Transcript_100476/g.299782 Transcript_100476/m.299782 type:complete len:278 (-) Transcript_100476:488-1321(-)
MLQDLFCSVLCRRRCARAARKRSASCQSQKPLRPTPAPSRVQGLARDELPRERDQVHLVRLHGRLPVRAQPHEEVAEALRHQPVPGEPNDGVGQGLVGLVGPVEDHEGSRLSRVLRLEELEAGLAEGALPLEHAGGEGAGDEHAAAPHELAVRRVVLVVRTPPAGRSEPRPVAEVLGEPLQLVHDGAGLQHSVHLLEVLHAVVDEGARLRAVLGVDARVGQVRVRKVEVLVAELHLVEDAGALRKLAGEGELRLVDVDLDHAGARRLRHVDGNLAPP